MNNRSLTVAVLIHNANEQSLPCGRGFDSRRQFRAATVRERLVLLAETMIKTAIRKPARGVSFHALRENENPITEKQRNRVLHCVRAEVYRYASDFTN